MTETEERKLLDHKCLLDIDGWFYRRKGCFVPLWQLNHRCCHSWTTFRSSLLATWRSLLCLLWASILDTKRVMLPSQGKEASRLSQMSTVTGVLREYCLSLFCCDHLFTEVIRITDRWSKLRRLKSPIGDISQKV